MSHAYSSALKAEHAALLDEALRHDVLENHQAGNVAAPDTILSDIAAVLNRHSRENHSNTPDFILAGVTVAALNAFEQASNHRERWYGGALIPAVPGSPWVPDVQPVCDEGTQPHFVEDHGMQGWSHNPWSAACDKHLAGEPSCWRARCLTCQPSSGDDDS